MEHTVFKRSHILARFPTQMTFINLLAHALIGSSSAICDMPTRCVMKRGSCCSYQAFVTGNGFCELARMGETTSMASCDCSCAGGVLITDATLESLVHRSRPCWMCRLNSSIWNLILRPRRGGAREPVSVLREHS